MNERVSYSVAIRTLGTAGEKYKLLLKSIEKQTIKPERVIVVLPNGYVPPKVYLGCEEFVFSPKGMIKQRLEALNYIDSEYVLFCDDDVEFPDDFVEKLLAPLVDGSYYFSSGPLLSFLPPRGVKYVIASVLGGACTMLFDKDKYYVKILNTGGYSYNRHIKLDGRIYKAQSLAWTVFLAETEAMEKICFQDELWIEKIGYAAYDDQTMFYKANINNLGVCIVSDALYKHNDAKTSTRDLKWEPAYAGIFNHYVFWHRFLYNTETNYIKKLWKKICIIYYEFMTKVYDLLLLKEKRITKEIFEIKKKAFKDARKYVASDEYKTLPSVYCGGNK